MKHIDLKCWILERTNTVLETTHVLSQTILSFQGTSHNSELQRGWQHYEISLYMIFSHVLHQGHYHLMCTLPPHIILQRKEYIVLCCVHCSVQCTLISTVYSKHGIQFILSDVCTCCTSFTVYWTHSVSLVYTEVRTSPIRRHTYLLIPHNHVFFTLYYTLY